MKNSDITSFVFIEFEEPEINALLSQLRATFMGKPSSPIHITIRGPISGPVSGKDLSSWRRKIINSAILISGIGRFHNNDEHIIYIKVENNDLRKIWSKPEYPIKEYGFNPHITLYSGNDASKADRIMNFLVNEDIRLMSHLFSITPYVSKQLGLQLHDQSNSHKPNLSFQKLIHVGRIKADIIERAKLATNPEKE